MRNYEEKLTIQTLAQDLDYLREELAEKDIRIEKLEDWKRNCGMVASTWGGILVAVTTIGGAIGTYWNQIESFFKSLPRGLP